MTIFGLFGLTLMGGSVRAESLAEAWSTALSNNAHLAAAQLESQAARHDLDASTAERLPEVSVFSSYILRSDTPSFRVQSPVPGLGTFQFPYAQTNAAVAGTRVKVPIYTSGRIRNLVDGARMRFTAAECDAAYSQLDLMFAVAKAYLAILRSQRNVEVAERELASLSAHEADVEKAYSEQRVQRNDLLGTQVATASARQRRLREISHLNNRRGSYNRLLGRPVLTEIAVEEVDLPPLPLSLEQLTQIAWRERPDLQKLQFLARSRDFEAKRIRATSWPQVSASGALDYEENEFNRPQALGTAAVTVDWNLMDSGRSRSAAAAQRARAVSLARQADDLKSQIALDLLSAWNDRFEASERIAVARQRLQHAEENLRISQLRYGRGMAVHADVLDAQSWWTEALRDVYHAGYDRTLAELRLRQAAGLLGRESNVIGPPAAPSELGSTSSDRGQMHWKG